MINDSTTVGAPSLQLEANDVLDALTGAVEPHQADRVLIAQIHGRDYSALGVLYDRYGALIYTLALRVTDSEAAAEALVGEVFSKCWHSSEHFFEGELSACMIATTLLCAHNAGGADRLLAARSSTPPMDMDAEQRLAHSDATASRVQLALAALPHDQRQAIELAYYTGLRQAELAARLRMPWQTVVRSLRLGMHTLSAQLRAGEQA